MKCMWILTAILLIGGMGTGPCFGASIRITEILTAGLAGASGPTPAYVEITAPNQQAPFELVMIDIRDAWLGRVTDVVRIDPTTSNVDIYLVHEDTWPTNLPAGAGVSADGLGFDGVANARALLVFDYVTGLSRFSPVGSVLDHTWVDAFSYAFGSPSIDAGWDDEVVQLDYGDAVYRTLHQDGGIVTGPVDEHLIFDNGLMMDPARYSYADLSRYTDGVVVPEPTTAGLLGLIIAGLAGGRATGRPARRRRCSRDRFAAGNRPATAR